jgi:hypothetical protein
MMRDINNQKIIFISIIIGLIASFGQYHIAVAENEGNSFWFISIMCIQIIKYYQSQPVFTG